MAVRVIAELPEQTSAQDHAKPGLAPDDGGVRMSAELASQVLLQGRDLLIEAAERGHQSAHHLPVGALDRRGRGQL
jgi:hypothetical protein